MSELTPNLKLFKYNTETDAKQPFSINDCMNANWDKIDASLRINDKLTNCLLEVPQRIKLELNDGVLTLKAGSEIIVPNGFEADGTTPKFDYITIESDISTTHTGDLGASFVYYTESYDNPALAFSVIGATISGASIKANYTIYNTSTNKVNYLDDNSEVQDERSLPIAIVQRTGSISSIDEVFNGFGYIGSTIFALPGVKGLMPNGRNADGSLNNIEFTTQKMLLRNNTNSGSGYLAIVDGGTRVSIAHKQNWNFDEKSNSILENGVIRDNIGFYGGVTLDTGGIVTSFNPKLPFRAVDYNDKSEIISWGMPDYINAVETSLGMNVWRTAAYDCFIIGHVSCNTNGGGVIALKDKDGKNVPINATGTQGEVAYSQTGNILMRCFVPKGYSYAFRVRDAGGKINYTWEVPLKGVI